MKKTIKTPYSIEDLKKDIELGVRRAIGIKISEPGTLAAHKVAALLQTIAPEYSLYAGEVASMEIEPRFVWGLISRNGRDYEEEFRRPHYRNIFNNLVASELKKQARNVVQVGEILGEHCRYIEKLPQDRRDELDELEAGILEENPELAAALSELARINEYKLAARLEDVIKGGAGIVEIAGFIRENILNLSRKILIARYSEPKASTDGNI